MKLRPDNAVRRYILDNVVNHPEDIGPHVMRKFGVTRQAVSRHIKKLVDAGYLVPSGNTRARSYTLGRLVDAKLRFNLSEITEDQVWRELNQDLPADLSENVRNIVAFGVTEVVKNAIDHSWGETLRVRGRVNAAEIEVIISDDGAGMLQVIRDQLNFLDDHHLLFQLGKGKLTTRPGTHKGEALFFCLHAFDRVGIRCENLEFTHDRSTGEWQTSPLALRQKGTSVYLSIPVHSNRTLQSIHDAHSSEPGQQDLSRAFVRVAALQRDGQPLLTRSEARQLMNGLENFEEVTLDFRGVASVGRSFADEVFQVKGEIEGSTKLVWKNLSADVAKVVQDIATGSEVSTGAL